MLSVADPKCPGSTIETATPNLFISSLSESENASTAYFVMEYAAVKGTTKRPFTELTLTIRPKCNMQTLTKQNTAASMFTVQINTTSV